MKNSNVFIKSYYKKFFVFEQKKKCHPTEKCLDTSLMYTETFILSFNRSFLISKKYYINIQKLK